MDLADASKRVLLGESIASLAAAYRQSLLDSVGLTAEEATPDTFRKETLRFAGKLCRHLAERMPAGSQIEAALIDWVSMVDDYEAFDALLANYRDFDGRAALLRRGKALFPRALTAHWEEE
ncbi:MAG TPA: hypothetical protein VK081_13890 [Planctomycetota bacterium]|nr:hypothetical protein [Planctomycetota bacterium]